MSSCWNDVAPLRAAWGFLQETASSMLTQSGHPPRGNAERTGSPASGGHLDDRKCERQRTGNELHWNNASVPRGAAFAYDKQLDRIKLTSDPVTELV